MEEMKHILIIGGGLAGCTAALELADRGHQVSIVERDAVIGGKVRTYGCKATEVCNKCGLCLVGDLWHRVENDKKIKIYTGHQVVDIFGEKGNFDVVVKDNENRQTLANISDIIVAAGFDIPSSYSLGNLELTSPDGIITGYQLESILNKRNDKSLFFQAPSKVAFIQCFGSRDLREKAAYCSRVCCGYSTRAAKVIKYCYPQTKITFFYMDMQQVEPGDYMDTLLKDGIEFIKSRPVKIRGPKPWTVIYEEPGSSGASKRKFDLIVLSEGIHPSEGLDKIAEICGLGFNDDGFLRCVKDGSSTGIYLAGCVSGPKTIEEVYTQALTVAGEICGGVL